MDSMWTYKQQLFTNVRKLFEAFWKKEQEKQELEENEWELEMNFLENSRKRKCSPICKTAEKKFCSNN